MPPRGFMKDTVPRWLGVAAAVVAREAVSWSSLGGQRCIALRRVGKRVLGFVLRWQAPSLASRGDEALLRAVCRSQLQTRHQGLWMCMRC